VAKLFLLGGHGMDDKIAEKFIAFA